ncbi:HAD-IIB family hydrolase [Bifidobacterium sp.]|jgi:HAD superfamily hydrolase (TIGR01484 family)|uniref:HAD-IIB family hydrolase n=1 Tax=Bifidobacterium sp. TaxID=41200 RepID=UPI0025BDA53B|nr:HAD-IIB family hydrolase [Bifidobacterium sp.]MCH4209167.1 HAD-IIB family hydrolase [Bifidobacterium sp.]MCI1224613.1 HAD-IIB family hydrolase [Bifidobacterium sp.]
MDVCHVPVWTELDMDAVGAKAGIIAFDLDNTLARSKQPMKADMARCISMLTRLRPLAIITGGRFELVKSQVLNELDDTACRENMHLMPTSGTRYYRWNGAAWHCEYAHDLDPAERRAVVASFERHAREQGLWFEHPWGRRVEDRGSQITFSALGQEAPIEQKETWDPDNSKKNCLAAAVGADFPHLAVHSGGSTSVDVSRRGVDKAYAVRELSAMTSVPVGRVVYVGDRMDPDGNDYPAALAGTIAIRVSGPHDTLEVCKELIARLS